MKEGSGLQAIQEIYKDPKWFFCVDPQNGHYSVFGEYLMGVIILEHSHNDQCPSHNCLYIAGEKFLPLNPINISEGQVVVPVYSEAEMVHRPAITSLLILKCSDYFADPLKPTEIELEEYELTFGEPYMYSQKYFEEFKKTHYESLNSFERLSFHVRGLIWEVAKVVKLL